MLPEFSNDDEAWRARAQTRVPRVSLLRSAMVMGPRHPWQRPQSPASPASPFDAAVEARFEIVSCAREIAGCFIMCSHLSLRKWERTATYRRHLRPFRQPTVRSKTSRRKAKLCCVKKSDRCSLRFCGGEIALIQGCWGVARRQRRALAQVAAAFLKRKLSSTRPTCMDSPAAPSAAQVEGHRQGRWANSLSAKRLHCPALLACFRLLLPPGHRAVIPVFLESSALRFASPRP